MTYVSSKTWFAYLPVCTSQKTRQRQTSDVEIIAMRKTASGHREPKCSNEFISCSLQFEIISHLAKEGRPDENRSSQHNAVTWQGSSDRQSVCYRRYTRLRERAQSSIVLSSYIDMAPREIPSLNSKYSARLICYIKNFRLIISQYSYTTTEIHG